MSRLADIYRPSLSLLTDLYQLTMAYGYWQQGLAEREAVFHLFFRKNPFGGGYSIACGLEQVLDLCEDFAFADEDLAFLRGVRGSDGEPLFAPAFIDYLADLELQCELAAVPEGTAVFPHEPLVRVQGPVLQCQIIETPLLNLVNFQTLIATKAARICHATRGEPVLEFGLRRAQGIDGSLSASRAAYIGGCTGTSNLLAGRLFGIPVKGTHAHSWVMLFPDELSSFEAYAEALPNNCLFLVDTYDTLTGVKNAITVGHKLRASGHRLLGVRLDSGDLAYLSKKARQMLDEAGFVDAAVVASNELDELLVRSLKDQQAAISVWGIGTKLATAYDQPALGGVYKLSAVRDESGQWQHRVKLSEQAIKTSNPGIQQVRRYRRGDRFVADAIYDTLLGIPEPCTIVDQTDVTRQKLLAAGLQSDDLLVPVFAQGKRLHDPLDLESIRARVTNQLLGLHTGIKRNHHPHQYPVGLESGLFAKKIELVKEARGIRS